MAEFTMRVVTGDTDSFYDKDHNYNPNAELARILREMADAIEGGIGSRLHGNFLADSNGELVGRWDWSD